MIGKKDTMEEVVMFAFFNEVGEQEGVVVREGVDLRFSYNDKRYNDGVDVEAIFMAGDQRMQVEARPWKSYMEGGGMWEWTRLRHEFGWKSRVLFRGMLAEVMGILEAE